MVIRCGSLNLLNKGTALDNPLSAAGDELLRARHFDCGLEFSYSARLF